jgi:hypothetical protein
MNILESDHNGPGLKCFDHFVTEIVRS